MEYNREIITYKEALRIAETEKNRRGDEIFHTKMEFVLILQHRFYWQFEILPKIYLDTFNLGYNVLGNFPTIIDFYGNLFPSGFRGCFDKEFNKFYKQYYHTYNNFDDFFTDLRKLNSKLCDSRRSKVWDLICKFRERRFLNKYPKVIYRNDHFYKNRNKLDHFELPDK